MDLRTTGLRRLPRTDRPVLLFALALALCPTAVMAGLPGRPVELWRWHGPTQDPARPWPTLAIAVPLTDDDGDGDIDRDDGPDVVFVHYGEPNRASQAMTAVDGRTGEPLFTVDTPAFGSGHLLSATAPLAAGDVDGDGKVELLVVRTEQSRPVPEPAKLIAFEHDGSHAWTRDWPGSIENLGQSLGLADFNQDGVVEAYLLGTVASVDGSLGWSRTLMLPGTREESCFSQAVDLDPSSPGLELLYGANLFSATGEEIWGDWFNPMGASGIGDLDGDGDVEVVVIQNATLYAYDAQGNEMSPSVVVRSPQNGSERPSAPVVADVDGDGADEVVFSIRDVLLCYGWDGTALVEEWSVPADDSSGLSGPTAFDFDGDGAAEIVYHDQSSWRILDGRDGAVLYRELLNSRTLTESPIVVGLGDDCGALIVVTGFGDIPSDDALADDAVVAYLVPGASSPRRIWNQRTYHVTNVTEDGAIPRFEEPAWMAAQGWQAQAGVPLGSALEFSTARLVDPSDCNLGIEVSWDAAIPDIPGTPVVYDVHRSEGPPEPSCDAALASAPLVTGLSAQSWFDGTTEPGRSYVYLVRARVAGTAACSAPADACVGPIVEQGEPRPEGVGATLRAGHDGHDVTFTWESARALLPAEHFHLLKASWTPTSLYSTVTPEGASVRFHAETDLTSSLQFFDLRVANNCEEISADEYPATR